MQDWESVFLKQEEAAAEAAMGTRVLFGKMARELTDALERAEKAEQESTVYERRLQEEVELREVYEEEILKLRRMLECTDAEKPQEDVVPLQFKLHEPEDDRDQHNKRLRDEIEMREQYERDILKLQDLASDKDDELQKLENKLQEEVKIRSKLESQVLELKLSLSALESEKTSSMATLQALLGPPGRLQSGAVELGNNMHQFQEFVSRGDHEDSAGDGQPASRDNDSAAPLDPDRQAAIAEHLQIIADNLQEGQGDDISPLEVLEALMDTEARALNLDWNNGAHPPLNGAVTPTREKSVQVTSTESEEKDVLIEHLKLNLDAVLKELEETKSVYGFVV